MCIALHVITYIVNTYIERGGGKTNLLRLTVVVEGVEVGGGAETGVQVCGGHGWRHPLVVGEEGQQRLTAGFWVVAVGPVSVHELDGFPQDVLALRVAVKVVHEARHGVVKVVGLHTIVIVDDELYELQALALVDPQHDVVVEELPCRAKRRGMSLMADHWDHRSLEVKMLKKS